LIGWLLDTNVVSELMRRAGDDRVIAWAAGQPADLLFISVLTLAEYDKGIQNLAVDQPARARFQAALRAVELRFADRKLSVSDAIVRRWGRLSGEIGRVRGRAPAVVDTLLAATAIEHDLCLVTRNVKDVRHTGATIFNPWTDDPAAVAHL
jgi:predicted nucleic acid-binding protein